MLILHYCVGSCLFSHVLFSKFIDLILPFIMLQHL